MNDQDRDRIDQITRVIYRLLNGKPVEPIDTACQVDDEIRQLSGYVNKMIAGLNDVARAATDLAEGRLGTHIPTRLPCANAVKSLQATLRHLSWQTSQVAKGDYTQRTDFLGEFSTSFNWMVEELENHRHQLEKTVQERTGELSLLLETTVKTAQSKDLNQILALFSNTLIHSFSYHTNCRVALFDAAVKRFWILSSESIRPARQTYDPDTPYPLSDFPFLESTVWKHKSRLVSLDKVRMGTIEKQLLFDEEFKSILILPFRDGQIPLGFVVISESRDLSRADFTSDNVRFYRTITNHLGIAIKNAQLFNTNRKIFLNTIEALAASIDARDTYTHFHSRNVMNYAMAIAGAMNFPAARLERLNIACLLHDIGKIGISDNILLKPSKLSSEEYAIIKSHPEKAIKILASVEELDDVTAIIVAHHERFDGKGYPYGLKGEQIPLESRIIAIADALDAMTTTRVYRPAFNRQAAIDEIARCSGTQFDPQLVDVFLKIAPTLNIVDQIGTLLNPEGDNDYITGSFTP